MKKALFVRTKYDVSTQYLYHWSQELIEEASKKGFEVAEIKDSRATPENIQSYLKKVKPDFVCLNGHGSKEVFYGQQNEEAITLSSANLLANTITFARACDCAAKLGQEAVSKGCNAFIGYNKPFLFPRQNEFESRPLKDPVATPVFTPSNTIASHLLKGATIEESVKASNRISAKEMNKWVFSTNPYAPAILRALILNDKSLQVHGDVEASLV